MTDRGDGLARIAAGPEEVDGRRVGTELVWVGDTARQDDAVVAPDVGVRVVRSTLNVSALSRWLKACAMPGRGATGSARPPAASTAAHGSVSPTCSMPSLATRKAMRLPLSRVVTVPFLSCSVGPRPVSDPPLTRRGSRRTQRPLRGGWFSCTGLLPASPRPVTGLLAPHSVARSRPVRLADA
jgi:hypothetical protein